MKQTLLATLLLAAVAASAEPAITSLLVRQQWPWSHAVTVDYTISGTEGRAHHLTVAAYNGNTFLCNIPDAALAGDTFPVSDGAKRITLNPSAVAALKTAGLLPAFKLKLSASDSVLYMVIDLTKTTNDTDKVTYITEGALTNNEYGTWERDFVKTNGVAVQSTVIWTGFTNDTQYATSRLVLRYIPAGSFMMGSPTDEIGHTEAASTLSTCYEGQHRVTLTQGFFMSVYPFTRGQFRQALGWTPQADHLAGEESLCSMNEISYDQLRGKVAEDGIDWPLTGTNLTSGSGIDILRARTGVLLDLPTQAQWQYACRAGTTGAWASGLTSTNATADLSLDEIGWYAHNTQRSGLQSVGQKNPNAWGLYDMQGNIWEWCLDYAMNGDFDSASVTDPVGPSSGNRRMMCGGSFYDAAFMSRSACAFGNGPGTTFWNIGFRLVALLP